ncbi:MAG: STAS domain-containing protein [Polyangiaceae bacterium]|nr:STAS domain-containing protein [Polyangiaceae bacterium]
MTQTDDSASVHILRSRIKRLRSLVFNLAAGELSRVEQFDVAERDEFAAIERTFVAFAGEFIASRQRTQELEAENAAVINRQNEMIRALTAPIIDVSDGIVTIPIVGALDAARSASLSTRLLEHIVSFGTTTVLIDLSGASDVNEDVIHELEKLTRAVQLLGAECVITGIRPEMASIIVSLGVTLGTRTVRTLGAALSEYTARRRR